MHTPKGAPPFILRQRHRGPLLEGPLVLKTETRGPLLRQDRRRACLIYIFVSCLHACMHCGPLVCSSQVSADVFLLFSPFSFLDVYLLLLLLQQQIVLQQQQSQQIVLQQQKQVMLHQQQHFVVRQQQQQQIVFSAVVAAAAGNFAAVLQQECCLDSKEEVCMRCLLGLHAFINACKGLAFSFPLAAGGPLLQR